MWHGNDFSFFNKRLEFQTLHVKRMWYCVNKCMLLYNLGAEHITDTSLARRPESQVTEDCYPVCQATD